MGVSRCTKRLTQVDPLKFANIFLARFSEPAIFINEPTGMPSQHSPDKEPLSLQVPRTTMMRLRRIARRRGVPLAQVVNEILAAQTATTELKAQDYAAIARATKQAEETGRRIATQYTDTP